MKHNLNKGKTLFNQDDIINSTIKNLYNIGIICDNNWDDLYLMSQYLKKIDSDYFRLHTLYFKNSSIIQKSNSNYLTILIKHSGDNLIDLSFNLIKIVDFWIIFTNKIEYLSPVSLILNKCQILNINYIIVREKVKDCEFYLNSQFEKFNLLSSLSFKKLLKFIIINNIIFDNKNISYEEFIKDINLDYNKFYLEKYSPDLILTNEIISNIKNNYRKIDNSKHQIRLLYDKDEAKKEKETKKINKQTQYLNFSEKRINFLNSFKNQ